MGKVIVEPDKDERGYVALKNGQVVVRGRTQTQAGDRAHDRRPNDTIEAARVRNTKGGIRDDFRVLHHPRRK